MVIYLNGFLFLNLTKLGFPVYSRFIVKLVLSLKLDLSLGTSFGTLIALTE